MGCTRSFLSIASFSPFNIFFFGKEGNILKLRWKSPLHYKHEPGWNPVCPKLTGEQWQREGQQKQQNSPPGPFLTVQVYLNCLSFNEVCHAFDASFLLFVGTLHLYFLLSSYPNSVKLIQKKKRKKKKKKTKQCAIKESVNRQGLLYRNKYYF